MTVSEVLNATATGLDATASALSDPIEKAATAGAAVVVRMIASIVSDRTAEESIAILERIRDHGVQPIGQAELDAQTKEVIDRG